MGLVPRSGWGAQPRTGGYSAWSGGGPVGTVGHWEGPHIGSADHSLCPSKVRGVQNYHQNHGYIDIAYNELDCEHGVRFEGRPRSVASAANGPQANATHYSCCALRGTGDAFGEQFKRALRQASDEIGGQRLGHRDVNSTSCPGDEQYEWIHAGQPVGGSPAPAPTPVPTPAPVILRRGSKGAQVRQLQTWLITVGFSCGPSGVDGDFGPATERAVRAFQTSAGIQIDGIAGPETLAHLYGALVVQKPGTPVVANVSNPAYAVMAFIAGCKQTVLRRGSKGAVVTVAQSQLNKLGGANLAIDGDFGPLTEAATRNFQTRQGIGVDGIIGPITWSRLIP